MAAIVCLFATLLAFTLFANRFVSEAIAVAVLVSIVVCRLRRKPARPAGVLLIMWFLSLFSPVDVSLRNTAKWSLAYVPAISTRHAYTRLREYEAQGLQRDVDFAVWNGDSEFVNVRAVPLVTIPTSIRLHTPLSDIGR